MPGNGSVRCPCLADRSPRARRRTWESSTTRWRSSPARPAASAGATAALLAEHGAKVVINDLDADAADETAGEIGGETAVLAGDLTKPGAPTR